MILILSIENDASTDLVIDWLLSWGEDFIRVSDNKKLVVKKMFFVNSWDITLEYDGRVFSLDDISAYWYRRGDFNISYKYVDFSSSISIEKEVTNSLKLEIYKIKELLHYVLNNKKGIGSFFDNNVNKLINIEIAARCGIVSPPSLITSQLQTLREFIHNNNNCITKAISETLFISDYCSSVIQSYTSEVCIDDLEGYDSHIFPSLVQINIVKKYELRIFYLDGFFYSMAIFSQLDPQTKTDFRNYNFAKPNRNIPYLLPKDIQIKLLKFMQIKGLKSGSIDMIVNEEDEYFFLEVNPIGQFGMTSEPCNYHLHYKIAEYLCQKKT